MNKNAIEKQTLNPSIFIANKIDLRVAYTFHNLADKTGQQKSLVKFYEHQLKISKQNLCFKSLIKLQKSAIKAIPYQNYFITFYFQRSRRLKTNMPETNLPSISFHLLNLCP